MIGTILRGHYKIIKQIGSGGFGQTYLAEDLDLPQRSLCVVKLFQPRTQDPEMLKNAKRLFDLEAEVLYKLGGHPQIPRLLAHFEQDGAFYLVQDYVDGHDLSKELTKGKQLAEAEVIRLLQDVLPILQFVHDAKVIHRDLKPANLMRRRSDGRIVIIDFGSVKEIKELSQNAPNSLTVAVGTAGFVPHEQMAGKPRFNSDIYALGMIAIFALTGVHPKRYPVDEETGEVAWQKFLGENPCSPALERLLSKMVRVSYRHRYQTAEEVMADLAKFAPAGGGTPQSTTTKPNWWLWGGVGSGVLLLGWVIIYFLFLQPNPSPNEPTPAPPSNHSIRHGVVQEG
jgi:serine/threonine protein kinase